MAKIAGSPRKGGNSEKLANAFIAEARHTRHTTVKFTTVDKHIKGCMPYQQGKRLFRTGRFRQPCAAAGTGEYGGVRDTVVLGHVSAAIKSGHR